MTAYYMGCMGSPGYKGCEIAWKYRYYAENDPSHLPTNYDRSYFAEAVLPSVESISIAIKSLAEI